MQKVVEGEREGEGENFQIECEKHTKVRLRFNPFPALIGKIYATDRASCVPIRVDFTVL